MVRSTLPWLFLLTLLPSPAPCQVQSYSIEIFGAFTTSSKLYPHPNDGDEFARAMYLSLDDIFHGGIEMRASITPVDLKIGIGTEFIQKTEIIDVPASFSTIPVRDGYRVIPIELTGYFQLPIGNDRLHVYLGGGIGIYMGERIYHYPGAAAAATSRTGGFGIHILSGGEFVLSNHWAIRSEIKFRDVQFESVNQFHQPSTFYQGTYLPLPQEPFASRFSIDGMTLRTGIAYYF